MINYSIDAQCHCEDPGEFEQTMNLKSEWKLVLEAQPLPSLLPPREGPELGEDRPPRGGLGEVFGLSTTDLCGSLPAASSAPGNLLIMCLHSKPHVFITCGISLLNVSSDRPRTHLAVYVVRGFEGLHMVLVWVPSVSTLGLGSWKTLKETSWLVSGQGSLSVWLCAHEGTWTSGKVPGWDAGLMADVQCVS